MKKWLSWLWRRTHANQPPTGAIPPVKWLRPNENPFCVDVLDCRSYATSMLSTTKDLQVANQYGALRTSSGEQFRGRSPQGTRKVVCELTYSLRRIPQRRTSVQVSSNGRQFICGQSALSDRPSRKQERSASEGERFLFRVARRRNLEVPCTSVTLVGICRTLRS